MNEATIDRYHARMRRVLDHVDRHLDCDLSLDALSAVAAFSKHHFHRQFAELFGIAVYRYVQLARLKRASYRLAFRHEVSIIEIALDSGYDAPEAFARAFKGRMGQAPSDFRKEPNWSLWQDACTPFHRARSRLMTNHSDKDVEIVDFPGAAVALLSHRGDPAAIGGTIRRFIAWRKASGLRPSASATFNILHNDPETVAPDDFRFDLCAATDGEVPPNEAGIVAGSIEPGRCARLRQIGSSDDLGAAISYLYRDWLPRSGEEPRDAPLFVQRVSFYPDLPENEAITDIFLPLQGRL